MVKLETGTHVYGGFARYETHYNYKDLNGGSSADTSTTFNGSSLYALYNDGDMAFGTGVTLPLILSGVAQEWAGRDVLTRIKVATLNQPLVVAGRFGDYSIGEA